MHVSVKLEPDDFGELLSVDRPYTEFGIAQRLKDDLITAFKNRIKERLANNLVKTRIDISTPLSNDGRGYVLLVIGREALEKGGVQITRLDLQLDTTPGVKVDEFRLEPPIACGYYGYGGWTASLPIIRRRKSMITRERHFIKAQGFWLPVELLPFQDQLINSCECPHHFLTPDVSNSNNSLYIVWTCNICGEAYTCECFRGVMETVSKPRWEITIPDFLSDSRLGWGNTSEGERKAILNSTHGPGSSLFTAKKHLQRVQYRNGICHFCRGMPSTLSYMMHVGTVIKHYRPYIMTEAIRSRISCRDAENRIRERLGVPHIGEGWVSETHLYHMIRMLFPQYQIEREASPEWLGSMRFDIYMPEARVAIEYQGQQHFHPVERFGGEEGFQKTRKRDALKRKKAVEAGVNVVEFIYDENLTEEKVYKRIRKVIHSRKSAV